MYVVRGLLCFLVMALAGPAYAQPGQASSSALDGPLAQQRWQARVPLTTLRLVDGRVQTGQIRYATEQGFAWQPAYGLRHWDTSSVWIRPQEVVSLDLRRRARPLLDGWYSVVHLWWVSNSVLWASSYKFYSVEQPIAVGIGFSMASAILGLGYVGLRSLLRSTDRTYFVSHTRSPLREYATFWQDLRRHSVHRSSDTTRHPLWEMRLRRSRFTLAAEVGHA